MSGAIKREIRFIRNVLGSSFWFALVALVVLFVSLLLVAVTPASADPGDDFWPYQEPAFPEGFTTGAVKLHFSIIDHACEASIGTGTCPGVDKHVTRMGVTLDHSNGKTTGHATMWERDAFPPCIDAADCGASTERRPTEADLVNPAWYLNLVEPEPMELSPAICYSVVQSVAKGTPGSDSWRCWIEAVNTNTDPEAEEGLGWTNRIEGHPDGEMTWMPTGSHIDVVICVGGEVCGE